MPRKANKENKYQGGGPSASTPTVKMDDSRLRQLETELAKQQARLMKQRDAEGEAQFTLEQARQAHAKTESRYLAGRCDDKLLAYAADKLDAAKRAYATAHEVCEETERLVAEVLPAALAEAKQAALIDLRDRLRARTQEAGRELALYLQAAKQVSDELRALHDTAEEHFAVLQMFKLKVSLVGATDLGDEGGYVAARAGVPDLSVAWLTGMPGATATLYAHWRKELDAYLEHSPAEMAEADKQARVTTLAQDERSYRESLRREAAQRQLEAMYEARVFGVPLGADSDADAAPVGD